MPHLEMSLELKFFPERQQGKERHCRTPWGNVSYALCWEASGGGRHSNPFQYSCLENPMDRGAWWATVYRESQDSQIRVDTTE